MSFQGAPWELYNLESDRTELNNLSAAEPERVASMSALWQKIAQDDLRTKPKVIGVSSAETESHLHREWTRFDEPLENRKPKRAVSSAAENRLPGIRPRKDTDLNIAEGILLLTTTGNDGGLAFDRLPEFADAAGPFTLCFEMKSSSTGSGEVYLTESSDTSLPNGAHATFDPAHSGEWEPFEISMPVTTRLDAFRLDLSSAPGEVQLRNLTLKAHDGSKMLTWPVSE